MNCVKSSSLVSYSDQALLDLFGSTTQKNDAIYQGNCQFDFTAGHLIPERLQELGMKMVF